MYKMAPRISAVPGSPGFPPSRRKRLGWLLQGRTMSENESNNLCHCGSGLPLRRCHGSVLKSAGDIPIGMGDPNAPVERVSLVGFPGTYQTMHMLYRFKGDDPRNKLPLRQ